MNRRGGYTLYGNVVELLLPLDRETRHQVSPYPFCMVRKTIARSKKG
jgi:hypothetical protein